MTALGRFLCRHGWHDWHFIGDGFLINTGSLILAHGEQKCSRCRKLRKKSFVVGERP